MPNAANDDKTSIVWFRRDLRLGDNRAFAHAAARGPVLPIYILDEAPNGRAIGGASRWWLHHSLAELSKALGGLVLACGDPTIILPRMVRRVGASGVYWNRCYEPGAIARDETLKATLLADGIDAASFNGSLLFEPWDIKTLGGGPFKVYAPFWRACLKERVAAPIQRPRFVLKQTNEFGENLEDWALRHKNPDWAKGFAGTWAPGELGAQSRLRSFLSSGIERYAELRDRADLENVSRLSPHLHFGEISPRQVWRATMMDAEREQHKRRGAEKFISELGWREFAYHLLYHFPELPERNWKRAFDAFPWAENQAHLAAWQRGKTGYPIVDAGMRELWATGYMHNRVRMIVASFLIKHLRIDWRRGQAWFWDTLVDADLANNAASWQWVAGSGADAAPYFRIFNPMEQGRKFDPEGAYVRQWCPELARLPDAVLHAPFEASAEILNFAGVVLGKTYPQPIVNHRDARAAALASYEHVKNST